MYSGAGKGHANHANQEKHDLTDASGMEPRKARDERGHTDRDQSPDDQSEKNERLAEK